MSLEAIERRLKVLEDIEEIKKLKVRYCAYCDDNYNPDGLASLYAEDAVFDRGTQGRLEGKQEIFNHFSRMPEFFAFAVHMVFNPIIEVDGDTATGKWYFLGALTYAERNQSVWASGRYDDEYVRINGEWKFKNQKITRFFWTPFEEGWAKTRFVSV